MCVTSSFNPISCSSGKELTLFLYTWWLLKAFTVQFSNTSISKKGFHVYTDVCACASWSSQYPARSSCVHARASVWHVYVFMEGIQITNEGIFRTSRFVAEVPDLWMEVFLQPYSSELESHGNFYTYLKKGMQSNGLCVNVSLCFTYKRFSICKICGCRHSAAYCTHL